MALWPNREDMQLITYETIKMWVQTRWVAGILHMP